MVSKLRVVDEQVNFVLRLNPVPLQRGELPHEKGTVFQV